MIRRIPILPTLIVLAAVAVMVRLGFWQLDRAAQRDFQLERYKTAPNLPAVTLRLPRDGAALLFRTATSDCAQPAQLRREGAGEQGTRYIFQCASGIWVQAGTFPNPAYDPRWVGGPVTGAVSTLPDHRTWLDAQLNPRPSEPMIVAETPVAGLRPNVRPDPDAIINSSHSYAVQWFLFALTALVIYALALRKRLRGI